MTMTNERKLQRLQQQQSQSHFVSGGTVLRVSVVFLLMAAAIYRPLPEKMTKTTVDRVAMHIIEPVLRFSYYYPASLCPTATCMMRWTRASLTTLSKLIGPIFDWDANLLMETTHWEGVKVRVYHPRTNESESNGAIIFIHGGGFVLGNTEMYESLTRTMAKQMSTRLFVSVDYRLAPETVFPGGLEDCERVLDFVIENGAAMYGVDPRKIIVMGDSAGGNLVAAITQRRRASRAEPKILGQVLMYPLLQLSDMQTYSYRYFRREMQGLAVVDPVSVAYYYLWYAGVDVNAHPEYALASTTNGHVSAQAAALRDELLDLSTLPAEFRDDLNGTDLPQPVKPIDVLMEYMTPFLTNPSFAPLMQHDLSELPPAMVATCEFDVLRDEGAIYAKRLQDAGVSTQWKHYANGFHAMLNFHNELEIARDALADIKQWTMSLLREVQLE